MIAVSSDAVVLERFHVVVSVDGDVDLDAIVDAGVDDSLDITRSTPSSKGTVNVQVAVYVDDHVYVKSL